MMMMKNSYHAGVALLLIAGCTSQDPRPLPEARVADALSALQSAVASCAAQRAACEAGDAAAASSCSDSFATCRAAAQADHGPSVDHAVNECAETSRSCRDAAQDEQAKAACKEQLKVCVGEDKPQPDAGVDAGEEHASPSPVADCISALRTCLEGDTAARACTSALQACVMDAVGNGPQQDGGKPEGPGNSGDAGRPEHPDAGNMSGEHPEAGRMDEPRPDAGKADEEHPPLDAGTDKMPDAGMSAEAMACKLAYEQCVASGEEKDVCARMSKDCRN